MPQIPKTQLEALSLNCDLLAEEGRGNSSVPYRKNKWNGLFSYKIEMEWTSKVKASRQSDQMDGSRGYFKSTGFGIRMPEFELSFIPLANNILAMRKLLLF